MKKYIIVETKEAIQQYQSIILSIFSEYIEIDKIKQETYQLIFHYQHDIEVSLEDIAINMMSDILTDLRIYESYLFDDEIDLDHHILFTQKKLKLIPLIKHVYLNDKVILKNLIHQVDLEYKKIILRRYDKDEIMIETIKTYLESNQNMIIASKKLYLHRNTLIQRLDKFMQTTGFDVRKFLDAYLIYSLIK